MDMWSKREFDLSRVELEERHKIQSELLCDDKIHVVCDEGYSWQQTQEDIELRFIGTSLTPIEAKSASVNIRSKHLTVGLEGRKLFDDDLFEAVRPEESTWAAVDGTLTVSLQKVPLHPPERNIWPRCRSSEPQKSQGISEVCETAHDKTVFLGSLQLGQDTCNDGTECAVSSYCADEGSSESDDGVVRRLKLLGGTSTRAEVERQKRERLVKESQRWHKGTKQEKWVNSHGEDPRHMPAAEVWRQGYQ